MNASPKHFAALSRIHAPQRQLRRAVGLLAAFATLAAPTVAHAAQGGVTVSSSSAKSTAAAKKKKARAKAASDSAEKPRSVSKPQLKRAQTLLRLYASGTHDAATRKVVKRFQKLRGIDATGVVDLSTYLQIKDAFALLEGGGIGVADSGAATGGDTVEASTPTFVVPANVAPITAQERELLDQIAECESKGDPTIVSSNGLYRGKYQFDKSTWKSVGGSGDPAAASEEEQDQRAAILLRQRGTAPWPVCGL